MRFLEQEIEKAQTVIKLGKLSLDFGLIGDVLDKPVIIFLFSFRLLALRF